MFRPIHFKKICVEKNEKRNHGYREKKKNHIFLKLTRTLFCPHNFHEIIGEKKMKNKNQTRKTSQISFENNLD